MPDIKNVNTTADENQQSPSNHSVAMDNQDTKVIHQETNTETKELSDDEIYDNMIFPA